MELEKLKKICPKKTIGKHISFQEQTTTLILGKKAVAKSGSLKFHNKKYTSREISKTQ